MFASLSRKTEAFALIGLRELPLNALIGLRSAVFNRMPAAGASLYTADFGLEDVTSTLEEPYGVVFLPDSGRLPEEGRDVGFEPCMAGLCAVGEAAKFTLEAVLGLVLIP